ncbi:acyl-CoA dehydrogenase family protein [Kibdelosporangium phytohabitans]|uniref:Acyl-CoA dehydrogenase/oxidase C-terminal domain-containing protein n=1 Tax=Kibdelosporangium phytohabitans TaxID=860235 RepID=A0A0N7F3N6_9PSEU|nr:acyl-CoA dehydrogenase family protein [Kibdelosporangium phytohabitans]ALG09135.1 hypothetical protein AOZ06_21440 [Kibdelosporangium phytohabitans]MBE1469652.1 alkylation response protein AidB-like acyl-CoA dehydrogenase [Kibdelosporangium phytohabitans]
MGWNAQPTGQVVFDGARIPAAGRLGQEGDGFRIAMSALDGGDETATQLCAMAKGFATDAGFDVANRALQLHGGHGYLSEYGVGKIVRDLRVHQILEGTNEIMRVIVSRGVLGAAS